MIKTGGTDGESKQGDWGVGKGRQQQRADGFTLSNNLRRSPVTTTVKTRNRKTWKRQSVLSQGEGEGEYEAKHDDYCEGARNRPGKQWHCSV